MQKCFRVPVVIHGLKFVLVELSECLALVRVEARVLHNFIAKIEWIILEIRHFKGGVLLNSALVTEAIVVAFAVVVDYSHTVEFLGRNGPLRSLRLGACVLSLASHVQFYFISIF